jgi:RNA polymerase sigma-70 factor (ECF subfamily)
VSTELATLQAAQDGDKGAFARLLAPYRRELRAHCYRMSGSLPDADDLLQESLLRAWKGLGRFEGRSSLRTWLYKVTTNACVDALERRGARLLPQDLGPAAGDGAAVGPSFDQPWLGPCPAELYSAAGATPEERHAERESVTLAFLVALQLLPARQRAVLLLREVLGWEASEVAGLLDLSVAAVNSALQRARATLAERAGEARAIPPPLGDPEVSSLLSRYLRAWELADIGALVALLREDATLAMPPMSQWFVGREAIAASIGGMVFAPAGPGAFRLEPTEANGLPAFAAFRREPGGGWQPLGLHLLEVRGGRISAIMAFLDPSLPAAFAPSGA